MALKGDLVSADLSNLFQMLSLNRKTGVLTVQDRANPLVRRRLFIDAQTIRLADGLTGPLPVALLVDSEHVTYEQWANARRQAEKYGHDLASMLRAQGALSADVEAALRVRAEKEAILDVFLWRNIRFWLDEDVAPRDLGASDGLLVDHLVMEAARRQDEWHFVVERTGSHRDIFRRLQTDEAALQDLSGMTRIVLDHVDGVDAAREIMRRTGLSNYFVDVALADLLERGLIAKLTLDELSEGADRLSQSGHAREGIRLLHCALRCDRTNVETHKRLAAAYLDIGEHTKGCAHYRFCASSLLATGNRREALSILQRVWQILPSHFGTLESIVRILADEDVEFTRQDRACLADARKLVTVLQDTGELARAADLAGLLAEINPRDRQAVGTFARINMRLGRRDKAVEAYLALGTGLREDGEYSQALDVFRTLAAIDAGCNRIYAEQVNELRMHVELKRRRSRRGRSRRLAMFGAGCLCVIWGGYVLLGEHALSALDEAAPTDPAAQESLGTEYRHLGSLYALTPAASRANAKAEFWFDAARLQHEAESVRIAKLTEDRARRQARAEEDAAAAERLMKRGELGAAVERLEGALRAAPETEGPFWDEVRRSLGDARQYVHGARALLSRAEALDLTDPAAAFRLRADAAREFGHFDEVKALQFHVTIDTVPPGAWLAVDDGIHEGHAPIQASVGGQKPVRVDARAPGCIAKSVTIPFPPSGPRVEIVLDRLAALSVDLGEPLVAVVPVSSTRALVAARNGRMHVVDTRGGQIITKYAPDTIELQTAAPVVSGDRILVRLADGRCRILEMNGLRSARQVQFESKVPVAAIPVPDGWIVVDGPGRIVRLDRDGVVRHEIRLPDGVTVARVAVATDGTVVAATSSGVVGVDLEGATLRPLVPGPASGVAPGADGGIVATCGRRLVQVGLTGAGHRELATFDADTTGVERLGPDLWLVRLGPKDAAVWGRGSKPARIAVPAALAPTAAIVDGGGQRVALMLESGWCGVYDTTTGRCVAGHSCDPGSTPAFVGNMFVAGHERGSLSFTTDG